MKDSIKYITVYAHATARGRQSITLERNRFKTSGFTKENKKSLGLFVRCCGHNAAIKFSQLIPEDKAQRGVRT